MIKLNGKLLWLAGVVIICFSLLVWQKVISETSYLTCTMLVLGYYFGETRAYVRQKNNESAAAAKGG